MNLFGKVLPPTYVLSEALNFLRECEIGMTGKCLGRSSECFHSGGGSDLVYPLHRIWKFNIDTVVFFTLDCSGAGMLCMIQQVIL